MKIASTPLKTKLTLHKNRIKKLIHFADLQALSNRYHKLKKKIVFTIGSFDLLHPGHCRYLAEAKAMGDILIVGVSSDLSEMRLKGSEYPLVKEDIRAELLSYLRTVDHVVILDEDKPFAEMLLIRPDTLYVSEDDVQKGIRGKQDKEIVDTFKGKIVVRSKPPEYYTINQLADYVANIRVAQILDSYFREHQKIADVKISSELKPADFGNQVPNIANAYNSNLFCLQNSDLSALRKQADTKSKSIVLVSGSYDLLHVGHARFIQQAALQGDILVVGIPSDQSIRILKGLGRPVISEKSRAYVLGHLDCVDYVTIFSDTTVLSTLETLKPDVFFTVNESWNDGYKKSPEFKLVKSYGGKYIFADRQAPFTSSSSIIDKLAFKKVKEIFSECMDDERFKRMHLEKSSLNKVN